jgi:hypothetical protein
MSSSIWIENGVMCRSDFNVDSLEYAHPPKPLVGCSGLLDGHFVEGLYSEVTVLTRLSAVFPDSDGTMKIRLV